MQPPLKQQSEISFQAEGEETAAGIQQPSTDEASEAETLVTGLAKGNAANNGAQPKLEPAELLLERVRDILLEVLVTPKKESEIAAMLQVSGAQMKLWLRKLVEDGILEKCSKRRGFVVARQKLV